MHEKKWGYRAMVAQLHRGKGIIVSVQAMKDYCQKVVAKRDQYGTAKDLSEHDSYLKDLMHEKKMGDRSMTRQLHEDKGICVSLQAMKDYLKDNREKLVAERERGLFQLGHNSFCHSCGVVYSRQPTILMIDVGAS